MNLFRTYILFFVSLFSIQQGWSQCAPGPFSVDPANAVPLDCQINVQIFDDVCEEDFVQVFTTSTQITVQSGTQHCFEIPAGNSGTFNPETCNTTTDDTVMTLFDEFGNVVTVNDDDGQFCGNGLQSEVFFFGNPGDIFCIQVESITGGVCDGIASQSPTYDVDIFCFAQNGGTIDFIEEIADDPIVSCESAGFSEVLTITNSDGLIVSQGSTPFDFQTDVAPVDAVYTSGFLTICARGDVNGSNEFWQIRDEAGNCLGGIGNSDDLGVGQCSETPVCTTVELSASDVATYVADGTVTFGAFNNGSIGGFCMGQGFDGFVSMELTLCSESIVPIPTLGEWGLIAMALLLLIVGVLYARQSSIALRGINEG